MAYALPPNNLVALLDKRENAEHRRQLLERDRELQRQSRYNTNPERGPQR